MAKTSNSKSASGRKPASKSATASRSSASRSSKASGSRNRSGNSNGDSSNGGQHPLLEKFFHEQLKDIYWAEKALPKALTKMKKNATTEELQQAFDEHIAVTQQQIARLEQVFEMMGKKAQAKKCEAMAGLIKEGESIIEDTEDDTMTRDVALIMAAQKVEHYEIASYGGLVQLAHTLGQPEIAGILEQTLQEEKDTDQLLTHIAENNVNMEAEMEGADGE